MPIGRLGCLRKAQHHWFLFCFFYFNVISFHFCKFKLALVRLFTKFRNAFYLFIYLFILRIPFCLNRADWAEVAVTSVSVSATAEFPLGLELSKQKTPEPVTSCQEVARPTNSTTPGVSSHRDLSLYLRGRAWPNDVQCVHVCVRDTDVTLMHKL